MNTMNDDIPFGLSHLEGIYTGTQAVYFPIEITCPPDLPNSCWEPWELPNDPPDNSWGEIHEYDLIVKIEPTSHPAYFHYIQWFSGSSGNWHRQSGALIVIDYEYTVKNASDGIRFFATNISSDYSINIEGDGIQHSEGLTEGVMRNASEIVIDYIGLEQQAVGTATLARAEIIGGSHEDPVITTNPDSINYLINRDGYPELVAMSIGNEIIQLTDSDEFLKEQSDIRLRMMGGNDYLEVTGGNNYANGNMGEDTIILRGGFGQYLGGRDSDNIEVFGAKEGTSVNGNLGEDLVTGTVAGVTYRGGKDNDVLAVSQGDVWGDKGADTFRTVAGDGFAVIQDYMIGEDMVEIEKEGSWSIEGNGLMFTCDCGDQLMLLLGIDDIDQVTIV